MSVGGIGAIRPAVVDQSTSAHAPAVRRTPSLAEPTMGSDAATGMATSFEGLGVEALAALLAADSAQAQAQLARDEERAAAKHEIDALHRQAQDLRDKAAAMKSEAGMSAALTVVGTAFSMAGSTSGLGGHQANVGEVFGRGTSQLADPLSKMTYGGKVGEADADASLASSDAKEASAERDDASARRRAAEDAVDKAQSALVGFVQERAAARRALLRGA